MEISDRDIFDYIFAPETLSPEVVNLLQQSNDFNNKVNFYAELQHSFISVIPDKLKIKIASKIPAYQPSTSVLIQEEKTTN